MSVASEITALTGDRDDIRTALVNKGISAASGHGFDSFASDIAAIAASSYTKLAEKDIAVTQTSTTATSVDSITISEAWTKAKMIYVRVRDKAGKRAGYFYGSDAFFINYNLANGSTSAITTAARMIHRYSASSQWAMYVGATTTGYGVYGYDINSSGRVRIYARYNSSYSLTIDGTFHVEIYALDWPDKVSPYDDPEAAAASVTDPLETMAVEEPEGETE